MTEMVTAAIFEVNGLEDSAAQADRFLGRMMPASFIIPPIEMFPVAANT